MLSNGVAECLDALFKILSSEPIGDVLEELYNKLDEIKDKGFPVEVDMIYQKLHELLHPDIEGELKFCPYCGSLVLIPLGSDGVHCENCGSFVGVDD